MSETPGNIIHHVRTFISKSSDVVHKPITMYGFIIIRVGLIIITPHASSRKSASPANGDVFLSVVLQSIRWFISYFLRLFDNALHFCLMKHSVYYWLFLLTLSIIWCNTSPLILRLYINAVVAVYLRSPGEHSG